MKQILAAVLACFALSCRPPSTRAPTDAGVSEIASAVSAFGAWDQSGQPPRLAPDGGCDEQCQHDEAVRDMERLMNSGF